MKSRFWIRGLLVFLVYAIAVAGVPFTKASPAEPVTLKLYDPSGAFEVQQMFAPRLSELNGKTICELSDSAWEHDRTFPLIRRLLQGLFPAVKIIPYTEFPHEIRAAGGGFAIDQDSTANMVKQKGCQAVVVGNAG